LTVATDARAPPLRTTKTWNALAPQLPEAVDVEKEFGMIDAIGPFTSMWSKLVDFCRSTADWLKEKIVCKIARRTAEVAWDALISFLQRMRDCVLERPASFIQSVICLLKTESPAERLLAIAVMLEDLTINNLWTRLLDALGIPTFVTRMEARIENEKEEAHRKEIREALIGNTRAILSETIPAPGAAKFNKYYDENGFVHERVTLVEKEFGMSIMSTLFGLASFKGPGVMGLIKDFNSVMSGWKNLHELVNNFLQYLPEWITRLFTITDPRKRYGVEAKRPGNPLYDTYQAYLGLLQGENCASACAHEYFQHAGVSQQLISLKSIHQMRFVTECIKRFQLALMLLCVQPLVALNPYPLS